MGVSFFNQFWNFGDSSNLRQGSNPAYGVSDFISFYPQLGNDSQGNPVVPTNVVQAFIDMANTSLQQARWRGAWQMAMGWFVAHFCTLWLQSYTSADRGAQAVFEAGRAQGVITGESVGDVSYSADANLSALDEWAAWNLTSYGQQLATMARVYGKGVMQIW